MTLSEKLVYALVRIEFICGQCGTIVDQTAEARKIAREAINEFNASKDAPETNIYEIAGNNAT